MGNRQGKFSKQRLSSTSPSITAIPRTKIPQEFSEIKLEDHCDGNCNSCSSIIRLSSILEKYAIWMKENEKRRQEVEDKNGSVVVYDNHKPKKSSKRKKSKVDKNGIYCIVNTKNYNNSTLLQDYDHIVSIHSYDDVHEYFTSKLNRGSQYVQNATNDNECNCDPRTCINLSRNNRDRRQISLDDDIRTRLYFGYIEPYEVNTQQIIDQIHSYIYHCFQLGYKISKKEMKILSPLSPNSSTKSIESSMFNNKERSVYDDYGENEVIDPDDQTEHIRKLSQLIAKKRETLIHVRGGTTDSSVAKFITNVEHHPHSTMGEELEMDSIEKIVGTNNSNDDDHDDDTDDDEEEEQQEEEEESEEKEKEEENEIENEIGDSFVELKYEPITSENTQTLHSEDILRSPEPEETEQKQMEPIPEDKQVDDKKDDEQIDINSYGKNKKIDINNNSSNIHNKNNNNNNSIYNDNSRRRRSITQLSFNHNNNNNKNDIDEPTDLIYNFGKRYYYWPYYGGNEWFLRPKYQSFKHELVNKLSMIQFEDLSCKARDHQRTQKYKQLVAGRGWWTKEYDIKSDTLISHSHILAMLVYCNFDNIHRDFASTYNKNSANEENKSLKYRHSYFAHLGKLLRECVEVFGQKLKDSKHKVFYHGVDREMLFLSTISSFKGPLSVSSDLSVLQLFCGENGLILELKKNDNDWNSGNMKYFDVGSVSDFGGQSELFFIGGMYQFCFDKIIHSRYSTDYKIYLKAINIITTMIRADRYYTPDDEQDFSDSIKKLIIHLFKHELNKGISNENRINSFAAFKQLRLQETTNNISQSFESSIASAPELSAYTPIGIVPSYRNTSIFTPTTSFSSCLPSYIDKLFHLFCNTVTKISINWYWMEHQHGITKEYKGYKFIKPFLCHNNNNDQDLGTLDIIDDDTKTDKCKQNLTIINQSDFDFIRLDLLSSIFKNVRILDVQNGLILTQGLMDYIWTTLNEQQSMIISNYKLQIINLYKIDADKSPLTFKDCYLKYHEKFKSINYQLSVQNLGKWDAKLVISLIDNN